MNAELLQKARHLAALITTIKQHVTGLATTGAELDLVDLQTSMASEIEAACDSTYEAAAHAAYALAAKLHVICMSIVVNNQLSEKVSADGERSMLAERIGWLQDIAEDYAEELVGAVEVACAQRPLEKAA